MQKILHLSLFCPITYTAKKPCPLRGEVVINVDHGREERKGQWKTECRSLREEEKEQNTGIKT